MLSTTAAGTSKYYRGDMGQTAIGNPQLMTSEASCVLNAWAIGVMVTAMTVTLYWT